MPEDIGPTPLAPPKGALVTADTVVADAPRGDGQDDRGRRRRRRGRGGRGARDANGTDAAAGSELATPTYAGNGHAMPGTEAVVDREPRIEQAPLFAEAPLFARSEIR